jgi:hypothetical protein
MGVSNSREDEEITNGKCEFCPLTNHFTKDHICSICSMVGDHGAWKHCKRCLLLDHTMQDHKCDRCVSMEEHSHPCKYCLEEHSSEDHVCFCGQRGHSYQDHDEKVLCDICQVPGHSTIQQHFSCDRCKLTLIDHEHKWCHNCQSCTATSRPHLGVCDCGGCLTYENNENPRIKCLRCHKLPNDEDRYVLEEFGIRIPWASIHSPV